MSQPGWYQDPAAPAMLRWWDGQRWGNAIPPGGVGGPDPTTDRAEEAKVGRRAAQALLGGAAAYTVIFALNALAIGELWPAYRRYLHALATSDGQPVSLHLPARAMAFYSIAELFDLGLLVVAVLFLIWFHKAATVARRAGLPAHHTPTLAVVWWFVPIVNLWFPYQAAVDLLPPGSPGRHTVIRWWTLWLATGFCGLLVGFASLFSTGLGLVGAVLGAAVAFRAAVAGRLVIDEVNRAHATILGR